MTVSGLGREGVSCGNVVSHVTHALCLASLVVDPTIEQGVPHRHRKPPSPQLGSQNSPTLHTPSFVVLLLEAPSLPDGCDAGLMSPRDVGPVTARPGGKA